MTDHTETDIIRQAQAGDLASWEPLVAAHQEAVFRFAYLKCGDTDEARDIAQETFIQAWKHIGDFDVTRDLRAWLLGITVNRARNHWRAAQRQLNYLREAFRERNAMPGAAEPAREDRALLWQAVRELPRDFAEIIYLRYFLDVPTAECAQALGIAKGTVKSRLSRALAALETHLRSHYPELALEWEHND